LFLTVAGPLAAMAANFAMLGLGYAEARCAFLAFRRDWLFSDGGNLLKTWISRAFFCDRPKAISSPKFSNIQAEKLAKELTISRRSLGQLQQSVG
jgi:hypothetical protein